MRGNLVEESERTWDESGAAYPLDEPAKQGLYNGAIRLGHRDRQLLTSSLPCSLSHTQRSTFLCSSRSEATLGRTAQTLYLRPRVPDGRCSTQHRREISFLPFHRQN